MTDERRGGLYFREARFFLAGDRDSALRHIHEARGLMGYMRDMNSLGGPEIQVRYATLDDGTKIKAVLMNGQYQAYIESPFGVGEVPKEVCDDFLSGLFVPSRSATHVIDDGTEFVEYVGVEWLYPSEYQMGLTPDLFATYPGDPEKIAPKLYSDAAAPELIYPGPPPFGTPPQVNWQIYSSCYSGAMRQAIQLYLGMPIDLAIVLYPDFPEIPPVPIYTYAYEGTHGLVQKFGYTDENPSFWLVRMPTDGYGVLAMNFPVCSLVSDEQLAHGVNWIPYSPVTVFPDDIPAAIADGTVIEVMSAADFNTEIGDYQPMYKDCGWAFSLSGHECQNVMTRTVDVSGGTETDFRVYTKRFTLSFTRTDGGLSAEIHGTDENLYFGTKPYLPRFPYEGMSLAMPIYDAYAAPHPSYTGGTDCAVHVFYSGDEAQIFRFVIDKSHTGPWDDGNYFNTIIPRQYGYIPVAGKYYGISHYPGTDIKYYTLNGETINDYTFSGSGIEYHLDSTSSSYSGPPYMGTSGSTSGGMQVFKPIAEIGYDLWVRSFTDRSNYTVLIVPLHQREAVYLLDANYEVLSPYNDTYSGVYAYETGMTYWMIRGSVDPGSGCGTDQANFRIIETSSKPSPYIESAELGAPYYPSLPVSQYYHTHIFGGLLLNGLTGCEGDVIVSGGGGESIPLAVTSVPGSKTWKGGFKFFSSGGHVDIPFGSSDDESELNPLKYKILDIQTSEDTTMQGFTDGISPDKYIVYDDNRSAAGSHAKTNTEYPVSEIDYWRKAFIGIAN